MDHRTRLAAGNQGAVRLVGAVGKDLAGHPQAHLPASLQHLAARQPQQDHVPVHTVNSLRDGYGQIHILAGHVVQCSVGLAVLKLHAMGGSEGQQSPHLILNVRLDLLGRANHIPPSKAHQIGIAGVRSYRHPGGLAGGHSTIHHQRIACMIPTGNIGGGNMGNDVLVQTNGIGAKALTQVTVQVDLIHRNLSFSFLMVAGVADLCSVRQRGARPLIVENAKYFCIFSIILMHFMPQVKGINSLFWVLLCFHNANNLSDPVVHALIHAKGRHLCVDMIKWSAYRGVLSPWNHNALEEPSIENQYIRHPV